MNGKNKKNGSLRAVLCCIVSGSDEDFCAFDLAGIHIIDKLFCAARGSSAFGKSPTFGKGKECVFIHLQFCVGGKLAYDGQIFRFSGGREADGKTKAVREGKLFFHCIASVYTVLAIGEIFFENVAAIGSCDDHNV